MKKVFLIVLVMLIAFSLVACDKNPTFEDTTTGGDTTTGDGSVNMECKIVVGDKIFDVILYDNNTAKAFKELLPLTINMSDLNDNEKYFNLATALTTNAQSVGTIQSGDIMLYGNNCLVLFYKMFRTSYSYTKLGTISNVSGLMEALGTGNVEVSFRVST